MTISKMKISVTRVYEVEGLGDRIRRERKASPKTITQLAAEAGISVAYWNRIETEKLVSLPIETLRAIEKVLEVSLGVSID
ncbi:MULTISPECIES: helix-turn-helix transcriptional regulator [unclassified Microcystis]|jgi:transcriptional regulator with XRE-family HTH domain|uniref:helix-turn-helix domain-containing protein n=1 Tax=unclassified Microcystis TaxID=2643300 RepID=UPI0022C7666C|nr:MULTISPECIES: helix-turn-helix transcriptional regulator [unclassified Microcystis]MCA2693197.1 helix-turn-helix transcriptional regulator [Microcystis sp. M034S2]MCA2751134.1 helix-turn-helix transcriptional regulator [Microcystis sp. M144S2]MCZ8126395.1 helix-turn-helix transcriptional regulator [Microcystis sp. LE19-114.1B]MCZ8202326.1 helix-turn-helix transcriptional regulator [Microcystis sp. LE19-55.1A]